MLRDFKFLHFMRCHCMGGYGDLAMVINIAYCLCNRTNVELPCWQQSKRSANKSCVCMQTAMLTIYKSSPQTGHRTEGIVWNNRALRATFTPCGRRIEKRSVLVNYLNETNKASDVVDVDTEGGAVFSHKKLHSAAAVCKSSVEVQLPSSVKRTPQSHRDARTVRHEFTARGLHREGAATEHMFNAADDEMLNVHRPHVLSFLRASPA